MALYDGDAEEQELERIFREIVEAPEPDTILEDLAAAVEPEPLREPRDELADLLDGRLRTARRGLDEAHDELQARARLHRQAEDEIGYQMQACQLSLREFKHFGLGYNIGVDVKRNFLEKQLADLRKERRQIKVRFFGELRELRRSFREAQAAYDRVWYRAMLVEDERDDKERA